jgi:hypothetical protein
MALLLTVLTIVIVNPLHLQVETIQQFLQLLVLLSVQNLLHLLHSLIQLLVVISHHNDMQRLVILKDVLLSFIGTSTTHRNSATGPLLDQFLRLSPWTDDLPDIVSLGVAEGVLREIYLFELLERSVVIRGDKSTIKKLVRLPHLNAILYERDAFPQEGVPLAYFPRVNTFSFIIVYGLRTGRSQVWILGSVVFHLGGELIKPVES